MSNCAILVANLKLTNKTYYVLVKFKGFGMTEEEKKTQTGL